MGRCPPKPLSGARGVTPSDWHFTASQVCRQGPARGTNFQRMGPIFSHELQQSNRQLFSGARHAGAIAHSVFGLRQQTGRAACVLG